MSNSSAYRRFQASMVLDYEKWHDGMGFDLSAIEEMTAAERLEVLSQLQSDEKTWREIEALEALYQYWSDHPAESPASLNRVADSIKKALESASDRDTRLAAAEVLHTFGELPEIDTTLAGEICELNRIGEGSVRTLLLAEQHPSNTVKQALLYASHQETECAMHCAALLLHLCGKADSAFDWSLRPFLLRLSNNPDQIDRTAALDELHTMSGMKFEPPEDFLPGRASK